MGAALELQPGPGPLPLHQEADFFHAPQLCLVDIAQLQPPPLALGVHAVHTEEVRGEEHGLLAPHAAADLHDDVPAVVGVPGEEEELHLLPQGLHLLAGLLHLLGPIQAAVGGAGLFGGDPLYQILHHLHRPGEGINVGAQVFPLPDPLEPKDVPDPGLEAAFRHLFGQVGGDEQHPGVTGVNHVPGEADRHADAAGGVDSH